MAGAIDGDEGLRAIEQRAQALGKAVFHHPVARAGKDNGRAVQLFKVAVVGKP